MMVLLIIVSVRIFLFFCFYSFKTKISNRRMNKLNGVLTLCVPKCNQVISLILEFPIEFQYNIYTNKSELRRYSRSTCCFHNYTSQTKIVETHSQYAIAIKKKWAGSTVLYHLTNDPIRICGYVLYNKHIDTTFYMLVRHSMTNVCIC